MLYRNEQNDNPINMILFQLEKQAQQATQFSGGKTRMMKFSIVNRIIHVL
jgi:hypothetical protein